MKKIKFGRDFYEKMKTVDEFAKAYDADKFHIDLQWILEVCPIRFDLIKYIQSKEEILNTITADDILISLWSIKACFNEDTNTSLIERCYYEMYLNKTKGVHPSLEDLCRATGNEFITNLGKEYAEKKFPLEK